MNRLSTFVVLFHSCLMWNIASGQVSHYGGIDLVTTPSVATATNALAQESNWLNDVSPFGTVHTVDFESMTPGNSANSFTIAPGVTMTALGTPGFPSTLEVLAGPHAQYPLINGFNSSTGGTNHMSFYQSPGNLSQPSVQFDFDQPICAFSTFLTGGPENSPFVGDFQISEINDSLGRRITDFGDLGNPYAPSDDQPNVRFGGFAGPTLSYSRIIVSYRFDSSSIDFEGTISFDDVRWVYANHIPEPTALSLFAAVALTTLTARLRSPWCSA